MDTRQTRHRNRLTRCQDVEPFGVLNRPHGKRLVVFISRAATSAARSGEIVIVSYPRCMAGNVATSVDVCALAQSTSTLTLVNRQSRTKSIKECGLLNPNTSAS